MPDFINLDKLGELNLNSLQLSLRGFRGYEEISRLFRFELEGDIPDNKVNKLKAEDVLGQPIGFSINGDQAYQFGGIVLSIQVGNIDNNVSSVGQSRRQVQLVVVPELWKLTQIINTRSFADATASALVGKVIGSTPVANTVTNRTLQAESGTPLRVNAQQYDENLLQFLARMLDEESIYYFFNNVSDSTVGREELIMGDAISGYEPIVGSSDESDDDSDEDTAEVTAIVLKYQSTTDPVAIVDWRRQLNFQPAFWTLQDYNYTYASNQQMTSSGENLSGTDEAGADTNYRKYRKAAGFYDGDAGKSMLDRHMEREERRREYVRASSDCPALFPGGCFTLEGHTTSSENGGYVITSIEHRADDRANVTPVYQNWFTCVETDDNPDDPPNPAVRCPHRADSSYPGKGDYCELAGVGWTANEYAGTVPAPGTTGSHHIQLVSPAAMPSAPASRDPETAFVCDDAGCYTSESASFGTVCTDADAGFGRVLIRFPWEEDGDFQPTRWVRVAQMTAGENWGSKFLPRVGDEVIVMYLDGTERKPMIVGMVYNSDRLLTSQMDSDIWKLTNETRSPFNTSQPDDGALTSKATDRLANLASVRESDDSDTPTGFEADDVPSLKHADVSGFRTRTNVKPPDDGAAQGYNELLFVDRPDFEQIYIRAERDLNIKVQNDWNIEVGGNKNEIIRGDFYRVANVGPAKNPYTDACSYPTLSDGGVIRSITDGINYDYDKVWQVWTVDPFSEGKPCKELDSSHNETYGQATFYRVSTETFADVHNFTKGDTKESFKGNYEEHFYGKKLEVVEGDCDDSPATITTRITGYTDEIFDGKTHAKFKGSEVKTTFEGVNVMDLYVGSNLVGLHLGAKEEFNFAATFELFLGAAVEIFIGSKAEFFIGNLATIHAGSKFELAPEHKEIKNAKTSIATSLGLMAIAIKLQGATTEID